MLHINTSCSNQIATHICHYFINILCAIYGKTRHCGLVENSSSLPPLEKTFEQIYNLILRIRLECVMYFLQVIPCEIYNYYYYWTFIIAWLIHTDKNALLSHFQ